MKYRVAALAALFLAQVSVAWAHGHHNKNLWLTGKTHDHDICVSGVMHSGLVRRFIETGAYDASVYAKGFKISCGTPLCRECRPDGFFSAVDAEKYIGNSPCWLGIRNLGGGAAFHRHHDRFHKKYETSVTGIILNPQFCGGATFGGSLGGIDTMLGIEPNAIQFNGGAVPTMHIKFLTESYAYSAPLKYRSASGRLFVGVQGSVTTPSMNKDWGLNIRPGYSAGGMVGVQWKLGFLRFGTAYGYQVQKGTTSHLKDGFVYAEKLSNYQEKMFALSQVGNRMMVAHKSAPSDIASPLVLDAGGHTHMVTSYLMATIKERFTIGLSAQCEWPREPRRPMQSKISLALGLLL